MDISEEVPIADGDEGAELNCSRAFLEKNGLDEDYFFSNESLSRDYEDLSALNCSDLRHMDNVNCSATDFLCLCAREIYLRTCFGFLKSTPEYYSYIYRIIGTCFQGIIFVIGVIGNVMVVIVVAKNRTMATPTNCYLVSLAVADCAVLVAAVPQEIVSYYLIGNHWIWGKIGCAVMIFIQHLGINASSLSLTAFTVERYIAICHPMKAQTVCTVERAKKITFLVWLFAIGYCSPWLFLTKVEPMNYDVSYPTQQCTFKLSREQYLYYYFLDIIVFYVVPLFLSCVLYSLIARILFASRVGKTAGNSINGLHDSKRSNIARVQVVKMLAVVVAIFATLWLPYRTMLVYNSLLAMFGHPPYIDLWYLLFAKTCIFINSAINPILYNALSVKFRRAFKKMLCCGTVQGSLRYTGTMYSECPAKRNLTLGNPVSTLDVPRSRSGTRSSRTRQSVISNRSEIRITIDRSFVKDDIMTMNDVNDPTVCETSLRSGEEVLHLNETSFCRNDSV